MNKNDVEQLINSLISVSNNQMPLESFKNNLKPNYEDENGNKCFHFLTEYTFKEYCYVLHFEWNVRKEIGNSPLGFGSNSQSPNPNPQSPIPNPHCLKNFNLKIIKQFKI